jgi:hypothetical protein
MFTTEIVRSSVAADRFYLNYQQRRENPSVVDLVLSRGDLERLAPIEDGIEPKGVTPDPAEAAYLAELISEWEWSNN